MFRQLWLRACKFLVLFAVLLPMVEGVYAQSASDNVFYIPYPEDEVLSTLTSINTDTDGTACTTSPADPITTLIGISVLTNGTIITVDHSEPTTATSGFEYEPDINNPVQASTEIWGDGNTANGFPPGIPSDVLNAGTYIEINNDITSTSQDLGGGALPYDYDAADKFGASLPVSVTRIAWATASETLFAGGFEVYDTSQLGTDYTFPVGENSPSGGASSSEFGYVGASVMSTADGTLVSVDLNGDGDFVDAGEVQNQLVDEGETFFIDGGIQEGGTVTATNDVQVDFVVGTICGNYRARFFTLYPTDLWSDSYYTPVDQPTTDTSETEVWLHNPGASAITVQVRRADGSGGIDTSDTVNVPAGTTVLYQMPENTGANFSSPGNNFYAITNVGIAHDWGFSLLPEGALSQQIFVGTGLGRDPQSATNPAENGSPVWLSVARLDGAVADGTIQVCVDYDNDGGPNDFGGRPYDDAFLFEVYENQKIFDPDGDQSSLFAFVCESDTDADFAILIAAWGEDPDTASPGQPGLDLGTGVPNVKSFLVDKESAFSDDINADGLANIGDIITYSVDVTNTGFVPLATLSIGVSDVLPTQYVEYIPNTSTFDPNDGSGPVPIADDTVGSTIFPFDEGGTNVPVPIAIDEAVTFSYQVRVIAVPFAPEQICNQASGEGSTETDDDEECILPGTSSISGNVSEDTTGNGNGDTPLSGVTVTVQNLDGTTALDTNGNPLVTTTDASGNYIFNNVPPGDYNIVESDPSGYISVSSSDDVNDGAQDTETGSGTTPNVIPVSIVNGEGDTGNNFVDEQPATVSGHLYIDTNGNGVQDPGEPDLANVDVVITDSDGNTQTVSTDASGNWSATVPSGSTTANVDETDPDFPTGVTQTEGTDPTTVTAVAGQNTDAGIDGYYQPASVSGNVSEDVNGDGVADNNLSNVTVTLIDPGSGSIATDNNGNPLVTTTDANGNYSFNNVPPGNYNIVESDPAGLTSVSDGDVVIDGSDDTETNNGNTNDNIIPVTLIGAESDTGNNFLDERPATVSGHLYIDTNGNGTQDPGEPDLANVDVVITDSNGNPQTVSTDANGNWTATVPPGTTTANVDESDPDFPAGSTQTEGTDPTTVTAIGGQNTDAGIDGYFVPAGISGNVSEDTNLDGTGDTPLSGITVLLYSDPNGDGDPSDGTLVATEVTDGSGNYLFAGVTPGNYVLVEVDPAGYSSVSDSQSADGDNASNDDTNDNQIPVTIAFGESDVNNNFVDKRPASIAGTVWLDEDQDGINDIEEAGITGVQVELVGNGCTSGVDCPIVTTDANGDYHFPDVAPGSYTVNVVDTSLPAGLTNTAGNGGVDPKPVTAVAGEHVDDIDFGYIASPNTGAIGDRIWGDADGDGIQDPGEGGIEGVVVTLLDSDGNTVATTTTNANGDYLFTGVPFADDYVVSLSNTDPVLAGYTPTSGPQSEGGYTSAPVTLDASLTTVTDVDFGFDNPVLNTVRDTVWADTDGDGVRDAGEAGIAGVTVNIVDDNTGEVVATAITDDNGDVVFTGLPDGDYRLEITDNDNLLNGLDGTTPEGVTRVSDPVTVSGGADVNDNSFGYNNPGLISGTVYSDPNSNSDQDGGEPGIDNVTVTLLEDTDGDGNYETTVTTTTTNPDGSYAFDGLPPGDYRVVVTPPAGTQTEDPDVVINDATDITLGIGESSVENDFGYNNPALNDISGTVFLDPDKDGFEDPGEVGFEGITLDLIDSNGNVIASTMTDADGNYSFEGLPDGDYQVAVSDTASLLSGYDLTSGLDTLDVTLAGAPVTDVDFGYINEEETGSISGEVFLDENGNGLAEPTETNFGGVDVYLCSSPVASEPCDPTDPEFIAQTVSDANGEYVFTDLPAGEYVVDVDSSDLPPNLQNSVDPAPVSLSEGENVEDVDHGFIPSAGNGLIEGTTWIDANGNGIFDSGEAPLPGVQIAIFDPASPTPTTPVATITSGPDGNWSYPVNPLVNDLIVMYDPATVLSDLIQDQPTNLDPGDNQYIDVDVLTDSDNFIGGLDFGFEPQVAGSLGSISGTIYSDNDQNGSYVSADDGEFQGVSVNLVDPATGTILATTFTDANGNYSFTGLPDRDYQLVVSDTANVLQDMNVNENDIDQTSTTPISISGGNDVTNVNQGYVSDTRLGSLGNLVWIDVDEDGFADDGEPRVEGVTVQCWHDTDNSATPNVPGGTQQSPVPGVDNLIRTVTTDENGEYNCTSLPGAQYIAVVTDVNGALAGYTPTVVTGDVGDNFAKPLTYALTTASPDPNLTADFGVRASASISGTVYFDEGDPPSNNYESGTDTPLGGIEVQACETTSGRCITVFTQPDGSYEIPVTPGDWEVTVVTPPSGVVPNADPQTPSAPITVNVNDVITEVDFGYTNRIVTTPVSIAFFTATAVGGGVEFSWQTSMEVGTAGFDLYMRDTDGWVRINDDLIASKVVNAMQITDYRYMAYGVSGKWFAITDVSTDEVVTVHGPYKVDSVYGEQSEDMPIELQPASVNRASTSGVRSRIQSLLRQDSPPPPDDADSDLDDYEDDDDIDVHGERG